MIPAPNAPDPARNARAGVGTTPTEWTSVPMLVAPAVIAATNMSPDRRVSWPSTIERPGPPSWWAVARPRANASDGRRSRLAAPRIPSVPKSRVMRGPRTRVGAAASGHGRQGTGVGAGVGSAAWLGSAVGTGVGVAFGATV